MAQRNTNLRILSVAYANGRLTSDQYQTLRNQQLSAIEFGKTPPPIPPELNNIEIPTINVDPLRMQSASRGSKRLLLGMAVALLLVSAALIAVMVWQHMPAGETPEPAAPEATQPKPIATPSPISAVTHSAMQLIKTGGEDTQALDEFASQWQELSDSEQNMQRQSPWAAELTRTLQQRLRDSDPGSQRQTTLRILDWMGAPLQETPAPTEPAQEEGEADSSAEIRPGEPETASKDNKDNKDTEATAEPAGEDATRTESDQSGQETADDAGESTEQPADETAATEGEPNDAADDESGGDAADKEAVEEEEEPPNPTDTGYDTSPEYEPEPEFGKEARDAILGDTPGY